MTRDVDLADLKLIVRALHRDVSALDERLRRLETLVEDLRNERHGPPDLVVIPTTERHTLGA